MVLTDVFGQSQVMQLGKSEETGYHGYQSWRGANTVTKETM